MRYVEARKEKRHESSKMETTLHNMVNKCIPEADKCVDGDGDKRFNLVVSNARYCKRCACQGVGPESTMAKLTSMRDAAKVATTTSVGMSARSLPSKMFTILFKVTLVANQCGTIRSG